ncbi:MAG: hypothetical protein OCC46_02520 [Pseudodesulfovibrio sp.]
MFDENTNDLQERMEPRVLVAEAVCLIDCREQMVYLGPTVAERDEPVAPEESAVSSSDSLWD